MNTPIKKPSLLLHLTEIPRAIFETLRGLFFVFTHRYKSIGNGQRIVVVPGLITTDASTYLLRKFLSKLGFSVTGWGMGRNYGRMASLPILTKKIQRLHEESGQKIILIGWSMGGIFSREVAKKIPNAVKQVITIGSPFANVYAPNHAKWVFDLLNKKESVDHKFATQLPKPANVPTLAIYSKLDGIVPWQACMETTEDATHRNQKVRSSHFGMGANPSVMQLVEENLGK